MTASSRTLDEFRHVPIKHLLFKIQLRHIIRCPLESSYPTVVFIEITTYVILFDRPIGKVGLEKE